MDHKDTHSAGEPLSRVNSLSKISAQLDSNLQYSTSSALPVIRSWIKNYKKLYAVRKSLQESQVALRSVVDVVTGEFERRNPFASVIDIVQSKTFLENLSVVIATLPRDPNVKLKHAALVRVMASALLISLHPGSILSVGGEGDTSVPDTSPEAQRCAQAAALTIRRLLNLLNQQLGSAHCTMRAFRQNLLGFRFSFRLFIESLDEWKIMDADRMVMSMQGPYMFCYGAYRSALNSQSSPEGAGHAEIGAVVDSSLRQLERVRASMVQLVGKSRAAELQSNWQSEVDEQMAPASPTAQPPQELAGSPDSTSAADTDRPTASQGSPSRTSGDGSIGIGARNETLLASLSGMMGLDNDRLVHEICVNPSFRLPEVATDPFKLPVLWHLRRENGPVVYSHGGLKFPTTAQDSAGALSIAVPSALAKDSASDAEQLAADIASFKDMPHGSPMAGRIGATVDNSPSDEDLRTDQAGAPDDPQAASDIAVTDGAQAAAAAVVRTQEALKRSFLDIMGDQLIASLVTSPVTALDEQLCEGDVVPIVFASNENCRIAMMQSPPEHEGKRPMYQYDAMSARVVKLYYDEQDLINAKDASASVEAITDGSGNSGSSSSTTAPIGGDVIYLADGGAERGVDFRSRLVLSTDPPSGRPLISALKDVTLRLTDTVPNRPDVLQSLQRSIDADGLLLQMLSRRGVATAEDLIVGCLQPLILVLQSLQAVNKSELTGQWFAAFKAACVSGDDMDSNFNACVRNLPSFFEFMTSCIDDLRRDIANFYISQLAIALQSSGPPYLGQKLVSRCAEAVIAAQDGGPEGVHVDPEQLFPNTYTMLCSVLQQVAAPNAEGVTELAVIRELNEFADSRVRYRVDDIGVTRDMNMALAASAFVALIQVPYRLDTPESQSRLPEVVQWDGGRLAAVRDKIDILAIIASILMTVKQMQVKYKLSTARGGSKALEDWFETLHHKLDALLHEPNIAMPQIVAATVRHFSQLSCSRGTVGGTEHALPADYEGELSRALRHVVSEGNPVLSLFFRRICRILLSGLVGGDAIHSKTASFSLGSPAQIRALEEIVSDAAIVFRLSVKAHGNIYTALIQRARANLSIPL